MALALKNFREGSISAVVFEAVDSPLEVLSTEHDSYENYS
jgi:hypothetical protein